MSQFSDKLKKYTERRGITVVSFARQLGIDRATLHKMISGERRPTSAEQVTAICRLLMLSADEAAELKELYKITVMGENVYSRRLRVKRMIQRFSELEDGNGFGDLVQRSIAKIPPSVPPVMVCRTFDELAETARPMLGRSFMKGSGMKTICQPDRKLKELLGSCAFGRGIKEHIICFDNTADSEHNLNLFPEICAYAFIDNNYRPLCYYGNVREHINSMTLMPVLFVTDDLAICAEIDLGTSIIYTDPETVDFYRRVFDRMKAECFPFVEVDDSLSDMLRRLDNYPSYTLTFDRQPSVVLTLDDNDIKRMLALDKEYLNAALEKAGYLRKMFLDTGYISIFSEEGLRELVLKGICEELPSPDGGCLEADTRRQILTRMIEFSESGRYDYRIVDSEHASMGLRVNLVEGRHIKLVSRRPDRGMHFVDVSEQSIVSAFNDYIEYLMADGMVYSREKTLEIMRGYLEML
ncbi:Transcriptional regulator, contains XRE-family HTH domain [Ruminococcus sp. YE71]|uniref:helix-turn-helix domain-containing protein n=1 Tax=unclassified Ruminococcus TaxID=2608920 RepID=UPI0008877F56|nr:MULTISPECIES: helix-turn-helix transcriptional regulator [unclassified Ruminococcus]SDA15945.1 Transcriptional regulator, contains XRE-family HTH domain [Ruminococcus sp. YE78]SFW23530.1 Transcriptional regulator, contains XRE-family HTH domain [Ruminococcus sp. YE71]